MYKVRFYKDERGHEPVREYLEEMREKKDKDSRVNLNKIRDYIKTLQKLGTRAGEPFVKHIDGDIWELRPLRNRIMFAAWEKDGFVLLSHFIKKTQKTPKREIDKAKRLYEDLKQREK